jgi:tRNA threonylcarbamoyladenosine biosynthesis protein TsaB
MPSMIARLHFAHDSDTPKTAVSVAGREAPGTCMNACLLAFDTSTECMAVAVQSDAGAITWNGEGGAAASARLLPQIRLLMQQAGLELRQLQAIAFGSGPGAFTGLRTACAVAQGLALGAALPVVAVDSLLIVAEDARVEQPGALAQRAVPGIDVAMDARMGEVYAGSYRWSGMGWQRRMAPALHTLQGLHATWADEPPQCVAGTALQVFGATLHTGAATRVEHTVDRAAALMRLAQQLWRDGGGMDAALALPLYLRDKVALTMAERQQLRVGGAA